MANCLLRKIITIWLSGFLVFFLFGVYNLAYALTLTATEAVSVSAIVGGTIVITPGGGSHSGDIVIPQTAVSFSGFAYPNASVTLLEQGAIRVTVKADSTGYFTITLEEKYNRNILYSIFAEDTLGRRSLLINYPIVVQTGFITHLSGIRFAPTIVTDKSEVRFGDYLTINGYALPQKDLEVIIDGPQKKIFTLTSAKEGTYKIVLPLSLFPKGDYFVSIKYKDDPRTSKFVKFIIGEANILNLEALPAIPGDYNTDKIINLIDFSILAFWYGKDNPPVSVDVNADKKINLVDFSILAFYWTG